MPIETEGCGAWTYKEAPRLRVFFIEFKREQVGVVSVQQRKWKFMLNLLGFHVYTVDTDEQFDAILEEWR